MLHDLSGALQGRADDRLASVVARFDTALGNDPDYSFQAAAYHGGECVLDVWGGPHLRADSLMVPFSVTKNIIGFSVALLIERGELDLDERVAGYWPARPRARRRPQRGLRRLTLAGLAGSSALGARPWRHEPVGPAYAPAAWDRPRMSYACVYKPLPLTAQTDSGQADDKGFRGRRDHRWQSAVVVPSRQ